MIFRYTFLKALIEKCYLIFKKYTLTVRLHFKVHCEKQFTQFFTKFSHSGQTKKNTRRPIERCAGNF